MDLDDNLLGLATGWARVKVDQRPLLATLRRYWGIADMMSELGQIRPSWPARQLHPSA
jgi:hypothetical protein